MQVIGHRGAAALAPENTWAGFDLALGLGVDAIETDIQATSDGVLVLIHDSALDRTTDGAGPVAEMPWAAMRELDAGSWFDDRFARARVPRLDETLDRYGGRKHLALEIKAPGIEDGVLEAIREHDLLAQVTVTSFDWETVCRVKRACPEVHVGWLAHDVSPEAVERAVVAGLDQFCPPAAAVTRDLVAGWKALGLEVRAWGVRDVVLMERAVEAGVDGMTVDFPHLLLEALGMN